MVFILTILLQVSIHDLVAQREDIIPLIIQQGIPHQPTHHLMVTHLEEANLDPEAQAPLTIENSILLKPY
jgi:hypothetical protein